ncbi:MAG: uroporphyrinogen decarboxylase [Leptospirales bacterium]|nr:uroporphyrinogen decarboxylase [Leptospirales bacterium]
MNALDTSPLLLRALRGERTEQVPIWFMRQAGRYLPEYLATRQKMPFTDFMRDVDRAVRVSLQPYLRFGVDGVILFSDILTPLSGAGIALHFEEKRGPVLEQTIESDADLSRLDRFDPARDCAYVGEILGRLRTAIESAAGADFETVAGAGVDSWQTSRKGRGRPGLLGFAGAPFTLASYLIEGGTSRKFEKTKEACFQRSAFFSRLCTRLSDLVADHLQYQIKAGAEAVQIFDSWAGQLSAADYREFAAPYSARIIDRLRTMSPQTPVILFVGGGQHLLTEMCAQNPSALSLDWRASIAEALRVAPESMALQGNLDPLLLHGDAARLQAAIEQTLRLFDAHPGYVFNLGHGIHPGASLDNVSLMVRTVQGARRTLP